MTVPLDSTALITMRALQTAPSRHARQILAFVQRYRLDDMIFDDFTMYEVLVGLEEQGLVRQFRHAVDESGELDRALYRLTGKGAALLAGRKPTSDEIDAIIDVVRRHKLADLDEPTIATARRMSSLPNALVELIHARVVFYDAEYVYTKADLVNLVKEFERAAAGRWHPQELVAELDVERALGTIEFRWREERFRWEFEQEGDWVSRALEESIEEFARRELGGEFMIVPTNDQTRLYVFLESDALEDIRRILARS